MATLSIPLLCSTITYGNNVVYTYDAFTTVMSTSHDAGYHPWFVEVTMRYC